MKHAWVKTALAALAAAGISGCATTVDWGGPLGHYAYRYDSRPVVYGTDDYGYRDYGSYAAPVVVEAPVPYYHDDDDD